MPWTQNIVKITYNSTKMGSEEMPDHDDKHALEKKRGFIAI